LAEAPEPGFSPTPLCKGQRLALRIEYDGSGYSGWQAQPQLPGVLTVQQALEAALSAIGAAPLRVHCAGRTDTGVHATAQWVHFDAPARRSLKAWIVGGNARLPASVRIVDGLAVPDSFHARHSAVARRYDYLIANTRTAPALLAQRVLWVREAIDHQRMHEALQPLLGERDFTSFRAASCQSRTPMRFLSEASVHRRGDYLRLRLVANAFLHHMVRNLVGSALRVGRGEADTGWLATLLEQRDRRLAAATAPPDGLYLTGVDYTPDFAIPPSPTPTFFPA
jgi:tRNA pseudouridine38-40 synthase